MAKFKYPIDVTVFCIYSDESTTGEVEVELSDKEVEDIIKLIHETDTTDVESMELEEHLPEVYKKLEDACSSAAIRAAYTECLKDGYYNNFYEYNTRDVMHYCECNCGYEFKIDNSKYSGAEPDEIYDLIEDDKLEDFSNWLKNYINSSSDIEVIKLIEKQMGGSAELQGDETEYDIELPPAIIEMAELRQDK